MDKTSRKLQMRDSLAVINSLNREGVKARDAYRAALAKVDSLNRDDYTEKFLTGQREKARADYDAARDALWPKVSAELEALKNTLQEAHNTLDLTNPALVNAVTLIRQAGKGLDGESIQAINAQFRGDQAALRLLKGTYKDAGLTYDGNLDKVLYNDFDAVMAAFQLGHAAFTTGKNMNGFAAQLGRIADLEALDGLALDRAPDPTGFADAATRGAGFVVASDI